MSFGTAGGVPGRATVGDVVLADGCLFLDRLRTRNKNAFDWGLWGGGCMPTPRMAAELGLKSGILASQIGYSVTALQEVRKRHFLRHLYIKMLILPRQARDKHRESTQKKMPFSHRTSLAR